MYIKLKFFYIKFNFIYIAVELTYLNKNNEIFSLFKYVNNKVYRDL
ncbi:Hypothetical protein MCYN_0800 [Mycoplasmopsis cynos C142]|uniref:Uncharacterized protein n=1 Tax=Mycoplasmopsis cynos (strain C142) TaxID=1246955 RepID=L0RWN5_MYCC1|nr:Hypothetical protein MCYN_0800 [Mycoplasmopsis cynos C142]